MSIIIKNEEQNSYKYISGMAFNGIPHYKIGEEEILQGQFYVVNKEGKPEEVDFLIYFYDNVQLYLIKFFSGALGWYKVHGHTIPSGATINISKNFDENDINSLTSKENLIAKVTSNSDEGQGELGEFTIESFFKEDESQLAIWLACELESFSHVDFTYTMEPIDIEMPTGHFICLTADLDTYEPDADPFFETVAAYVYGGTCPGDCTTVYLGKNYPHICEECEGTGEVLNEQCPVCNGKRITQEQYEMLCGTYKAKVTPTLKDDGASDSEFKIHAIYENKPDSYICWGFTNRSDGAIKAISFSYTDPAKVCLSGDTLITMSDGSYKRLDSLVVGEEVLSNNGKITKITQLEKDQYGDYHTLYSFEKGIIINETYHHYFYNADRGFLLALPDWKIGECALTQDGEHVALLSKQRIDERVQRYGIWTDEGTYYANGLLSGTPQYNQNYLEEADIEKLVDIFTSLDQNLMNGFLGG